MVALVGRLRSPDTGYVEAWRQLAFRFRGDLRAPDTYLSQRESTLDLFGARGFKAPRTNLVPSHRRANGRSVTFPSERAPTVIWGARAWF